MKKSCLFAFAFVVFAPLSFAETATVPVTPEVEAIAADDADVPKLETKAEAKANEKTPKGSKVDVVDMSGSPPDVNYGKAGAPQLNVKFKVKDYDKNNDGLLALDEFPDDPAVRARFELTDINQDGYLSDEELMGW